jgi:hypothetical protein
VINLLAFYCLLAKFGNLEINRMFFTLTKERVVYHYYSPLLLLFWRWHGIEAGIILVYAHFYTTMLKSSNEAMKWWRRRNLLLLSLCRENTRVLACWCIGFDGNPLLCRDFLRLCYLKRRHLLLGKFLVGQLSKRTSFW